MPFELGNTLATGRPAGAANKITAQVRDMITEALTNAGGASYLERQANENPVAFMALVGKLLPLQVKQDTTNRKIVVHVGLPAAAGHSHSLGHTPPEASDSIQ